MKNQRRKLGSSKNRGKEEEHYSDREKWKKENMKIWKKKEEK